MFFKLKRKKTGEVERKQHGQAEMRRKSAQEWIPIKDVKNCIIYRRDGVLTAVIEVRPINISLLSENEKKRVISALHEVLNGLQEPVQWLSIGRAVDLDGYTASLERKSQETQDFVRKQLLKGYIRQAAEMASGGDTLERKFYVLISQKAGKYAEDELLNRARELAGNISSAGLSAEVCSDRQIVELLFTFFQPARSAYERAPDCTGPYMPPILKREGF
jgi:hypothetical protein